MDFPSSLKKSFNKRHSRKISAGEDTSLQEEEPILTRQQIQQHVEMNSFINSNTQARDFHEVIVKIDPSGSTGNIINSNSNSNNSNIWRDRSYEFWKDDPGSGGGGGGDGDDGFRFPRSTDQQDPPSKLIGQFVNKQRAAGTDMAFDVDYADDSNSGRNPKSPPETFIAVDLNEKDNNISKPHHKVPSKDIKVSFQSPRSDSDISEDEDEIHEMRPSSNMNSSEGRGGGEVLRCTSFQKRQSTILRTKTKSRLMDPPEPDRDRRASGKVKSSGQIKSSGVMNRVSGMLGIGAKPPPAGSAVGDDEEDDPLLDEDFPDELRKGNLNMLTILQWVSLILIVAALVCTLVIHEWKIHQFKGLNMWKWEVLVLVLICGRLVSGWGIRVVVFFIERNFLLRKRVLYFVYGVRKAVQNCIWLGLVLLAWHFLFDKRIGKETNTQFLRYVNKIMICFLVSALLWLVKTLMVKILASSFHVSTFFDRIQESLFNQYVIETLSGPPVIEIENNQDDDERTMNDIYQFQSVGVNVPPELKASAFKSGVLQRLPTRSLSKKFSRIGSSRKGNGEGNNNQDQGILIDHLHRWNPKNISAWNFKRLTKIVKHGVLSTLDEQIHESANADESSTQIRSELEAKAAARKIFQNVARRGSKYIYLVDLLRFMRHDEALKTMALLGGSTESQRISKYALKNWVVNAFRERKALALTLDDTKTAVNKLHQMVNVLVGIVIVIVCLLILELATSKVLVFISSQVVVVAFVFGNTCKTVFESIIFLFVMHPFDVGDRCEIDGVQMIVEEMNILNTIFLRFDNQKIFYPNSTLSTKCIGNYYRSPDMGDSVDFYIHVSTPAEKIAIIKQRISSYIESKKDHWYSAPSVVVMYLENLYSVKMSVWMRHRINHQDMGEKWMRRSLLIEEMVKIFKEFDIEYRLLARDINVRSMPTITTTRTPTELGCPK